MRRIQNTILAVLVFVAGIPAQTVLVKNATIWTQGPQATLAKADLLVENGKISKVGANLAQPAGALVIDAAGKHVTPGVIDAHSHSAGRGGINEGSNNITAEVRINDVINPEDENIYRQLAGGTTAINLLHGSANSIGGQNAVLKLKWHSTREGMLVPDAPPGIKFALGENPKRSASPNIAGVERRYPNTRMGVNESIRERFTAAREYAREWKEYKKLSEAEKARRVPPRRDLQLETLAEILAGERLVHSHAYRQDEILALIRLADEFGFRIATFQHVLEGYKVADEIAAHGAGGSTFSDWWAYKLEAWDAIPYNGAIMNKRGVAVSFNSDSSELARRLNLEAAKAVKYGGLDEVEALKFVTLNPARQLRIDKRVGSLEPGKDADFVIWSGHPLSVYTVAEQTWVEGVKQFDRQEDLAARAQQDKERAGLIERIKRGDQPRGGGPGGGPPRPAEAPKAAQAAAPKRPIPAAQPAEYRDRLAATGGSFAIVGATIHTVSKGDIANGTVVFEKGRITAVGAGVSTRGATIIDGRGKHVYPGMIDPGTTLGLTEIGSVPGGVDVAEIGQLNPNVNPALAVNPDSELIPVARANGITHALVNPTGGLISGTSALIRLDGWTYEDLTAATPVAMHIQWPRFRARGRGFGGGFPGQQTEQQLQQARERDMKTIRQAFEDARAYQKAKAANGPNFKVDPLWEGMLPVVEGRIPVIVSANEVRAIRSAVEWAEQEGVRIIIDGAGEVWRAATLLKEKKIPVIVDGILSLPGRESDPYDEAYSLAAKLHAAGVQFCIGGGSNMEASNVRNLPYHAGMAAAFGLPKDEALKAVTLYPAQILGLADKLGSIEAGKSASLVITSGDLLEIRTKVLASYIDGRPVDLNNNKHYRLYQKYNHRPKVPAESRLSAKR
jgi:imidazolonepropionase-like amidohydrolase